MVNFVSTTDIDSASLTWMEPVNAANLITEYVIYVCETSSSLFEDSSALEPDTTSYNVSGLQPNTYYTATVTASNSQGQGNDSTITFTTLRSIAMHFN